MSAVILNFADFHARKTVAQRVRDRLPGYAQCVIRYAEVFAESYQRKTGCSDNEAVSAGVRCAKQTDPTTPGAAA